MNKFLERLNSNEILVADGATGSNLQKMGLSCRSAINLGYQIDSLRGGGYTCEDIRDCGLDHVFAAHAGFSLFEIEDAMNLTNVDRGVVEEILTWGRIDNDFV